MQTALDALFVILFALAFGAGIAMTVHNLIAAERINRETQRVMQSVPARKRRQS